MSDPRKASCLNDAALNEDGKTYNGAVLDVGGAQPRKGLV